MDYELLTKWSNPDLPFTCRACCFDGDTYSASRALQRYVDLDILSFTLTVTQLFQTFACQVTKKKIISIQIHSFSMIYTKLGISIGQGLVMSRLNTIFGRCKQVIHLVDGHPATPCMCDWGDEWCLKRHILL